MKRKIRYQKHTNVLRPIPTTPSTQDSPFPISLPYTTMPSSPPSPVHPQNKVNNNNCIYTFHHCEKYNTRTTSTYVPKHVGALAVLKERPKKKETWQGKPQLRTCLSNSSSSSRHFGPQISAGVSNTIDDLNTRIISSGDLRRTAMPPGVSRADSAELIPSCSLSASDFSVRADCSPSPGFPPGRSSETCGRRHWATRGTYT